MIGIYQKLVLEGENVQPFLTTDNRLYAFSVCRI